MPIMAPDGNSECFYANKISWLSECSPKLVKYLFDRKRFKIILALQKRRQIEIDSDWLTVYNKMTHYDYDQNDVSAFLDLSVLKLRLRCDIMKEAVMIDQESVYKSDNSVIIVQYHINHMKVVMIVDDHRTVVVPDQEVEDVLALRTVVVVDVVIVITPQDVVVVTTHPEVTKTITEVEIQKVVDLHRVSLAIKYISDKYANQKMLLQAMHHLVKKVKQLKFDESLKSSNLFSVEKIRITTRHCWVDRDEYDVDWSNYHRTRPARVEYDLFKDAAGTTRDAYNNRANYSKPEVYDAIFNCLITSTKKSVLVNWLEDVGCDPNSVTLRKINSDEFVHPHSLDESDRVEEIKFTDIIHAWMFSVKNLDKIQIGSAKHVWAALEWVSFSFMQTRKGVGSSFTVVLPDLDKLIEMVDKSIQKFPKGASASGNVLPNMLNAYELKLSDITKKHQDTYVTGDGASDVLKGPLNYLFRYDDCAESVVNATNPFRSDMKMFQPTACQCRKTEVVAAVNNWKDEVPEFQGQHMAFTKQGKLFEVTEGMKPLIHECDDRCYKDCKHVGQPKLREVPHWAHILYAALGHKSHAYRTLQNGAAFKLFRSIKFIFERDVMKLKFNNENIQSNRQINPTKVLSMSELLYGWVRYLR